VEKYILVRVTTDVKPETVYYKEILWFVPHSKVYRKQL
jgi:hypothetical protein